MSTTMAIELITRINCDLHLQGGQHVDGETLPPIITPNGKPKVVDLCTICQKEINYLELLDLAVLVGRDPDNGKQVRKNPDSLDYECDYCDRAFAKAQGKSMHMRRTHAEELAADAEEQEEEGTIVVATHYCAPCDREFKRASALLAHERGHEHLETVAAMA